VAYAAELTVTCLVCYAIITHILAPFVDPSSNLLGGMWAVVATVFVFRDTHDQSVSAGLSRLVATCVSFALCFGYQLIWPYSPVGMAALIGIGAIIMMLLGRRDDIVTTGITTAVVLVVAGISPQTAWEQPILRLVDTVVGIVVGLAGAWIGSLLFAAFSGRLAGRYALQLKPQGRNDDA
jgi:uncharacterized membrane protein YgaE (UPF0421/DUF939 family)